MLSLLIIDLLLILLLNILLFECVYRVNSLTPLGLLPIPTESRVSFDAETRAKEMKKLHEQISSQMEKTNEAYKAKANKHRKQIDFSREI